jgi:hypothetical protein
MAGTSLSLGEHWEQFIKNEVSSGRYGFASKRMDILEADLCDIVIEFYRVYRPNA